MSARLARAALVALACLLALGGLAGASPAHADLFEPIELVSQGYLPSVGPESEQQAGYAHDPAISADGAYVTFDGSFGGMTGVWRRDLQTGEVQPVAVGQPVPGKHESECEPVTSGGPISACNAELPSISEDGQYVSFTTTAPLAPHEDTNTAPDVYVRNMDIEPSEQSSPACAQAEAADAEELESVCPYTLVSAADGSDEGLTYAGAAGLGSVAAGRTAMSEDLPGGLEVAFVTTAVSDLTDPQDPGLPATPAMQVAVRNLKTRETMLVSARYDAATGQAIPNEPVSSEKYGASYSPAATGAPPFPFATGHDTITEPIGASISADGTTVAWLGVNVAQQARTAAGEGGSQEYAEPLWRRISDGPTVPTRGITGSGEPESPACEASGGGASCQGPFKTTPATGMWAGAGEQDFVPQLSADGYTVALLAWALPASFPGEEARTDDVYVVDMHPGLTRVQALHAITEPSGDEGTGAEREATSGKIVDFALSPDGSEVAFTTRRTIFSLPTPTFVSPVAAAPGMVELFDADLTDETITRVTQGFEGGPSAQPHEETTINEDPYPIEDDGALSPSFSGDGNVLAFASTASNLVYGDGNTPPTNADDVEGPFDGSDVFVVRRNVFTPDPTPQSVSPVPPNPTPTVVWKLDATAQSLRNGEVPLYVLVPGPGSLSASAQGWIAVHVSNAAGARRRGNARRRSARTARAVVASVRRTLATVLRRVRGGEGELLSLTLTLAPAYRALARAKGGLSATVELTFTATGEPTLKQSLAIDFANTTPNPKSHATKRGRRR
jgi:WD40-like Beta Propeller Repeat